MVGRVLYPLAVPRDPRLQLRLFSELFPRFWLSYESSLSDAMNEPKQQMSRGVYNFFIGACKGTTHPRKVTIYLYTTSPCLFERARAPHDQSFHNLRASKPLNRRFFPL